MAEWSAHTNIMVGIVYIIGCLSLTASFGAGVWVGYWVWKDRKE
jgi:hypothetical protein